jgi:hypothetical protein
MLQSPSPQSVPSRRTHYLDNLPARYIPLSLTQSGRSGEAHAPSNAMATPLGLADTGPAQNRVL